jgi:DNA-binding transcriptional MerR regulator
MPKRTLIRDAAKACGLSATTLRRLDRKGVLVPARDLARRRVYSDADIARLRQLAGLDPEGK